MWSAMAEYEIFAIRYARRDAKRSDHFIGGDPHDAPMPMDYFVWVIRRTSADLGGRYRLHGGAGERSASARSCAARRRLALLGIDPATVEDVIVTHMHYDHVGNFDEFPQRALPHPGPRDGFRHRPLHVPPHVRPPFEVEDVVGMVRLDFMGRVSSTTARPRSRPASACITSAATPPACRSCA